MFDHEMRVTYTRDDDGIWIECKRTFQNLKSHMETEHPTYKHEDE